MGGPREGAYDHLLDDLIELEVDGVLLVEPCVAGTLRTWIFRMKERGKLEGTFRIVMYKEKGYVIKVAKENNGSES